MQRDSRDASSTRWSAPSWLWPVLVGVILVVAGVLRFWALGRQSLWFDELFSANAAMYGPSVAIKVTAQDTNPPLYYVLQALLMPMLGRTEWGLRAFSAAIGVLTTGVVYLAGRKLFDRATGTWAAALFAVALLPLQYAQEARMYSLLMFFAALTLWLFARLVEKPNLARAALLGLALAGLAYTHVYGYMAAPLLLVPVVLVPRLRRRIGKLMFVTYPIAAVLFFPWALVIPTQIAIVRGQVAKGNWWMLPVDSVTHAFLANLVAFAPGQAGLAAMVFMALLIVGLAAPVVWIEAFAAGPYDPAEDDAPAVGGSPAASPESANETLRDESTEASVDAEAKPADEPRAGEIVTEGDLLWVLLTLAVVPMLAGLIISKYVTPIATVRNSLVCLPAIYILVARGGTKLHWPGTVALASLLLFGVLQLPVLYSDTSKGEWRQATEIVLSQPKTGVLTQEWESDFNLEVYSKLIKGESWMHSMWADHLNAKPTPTGLIINSNPYYHIPKFIWQWDRIWVVSMTTKSSVADYMDHAAGWQLTETRDLGKPVMRLYTRVDAPKK
ncbi:MAG: glycosyltransferase family 39 protein [Coriobacteriia bacterium]|nr:glycosyltransferase family 39 protein [Coriobacteriia bacterium]